MEPERAVTQPFGAAVKGTEPLPVPATVEATKIHGALLVAVQEQAVCTPNDPAPPPTPMALAAGCRVMEQEAAPCVTGMVKLVPAPKTVMIACWLVGSVLAAAVYVSAPLPVTCPLTALAVERVSQGESEENPQEQAACVVTEMTPIPPLAETATWVGAIV
jgi:hypothetical protein